MIVRWLRVGLSLPLCFAALCTACGGEDQVQVTQRETEEAQPERSGPAGCYIEAERACDCELEEAACTEEVGIWVPSGCSSCAS